MSSSSSVVVASVGTRTAVGATAPATAAAVRAGVAGFAQHAFMVDTAGNRMIVAGAPYLTIDVTGVDRVMALAAPAAGEALAPLAAAVGEKPAVLVCVGLPGPRPGRPKSLSPILDCVQREVEASGAQVQNIRTIEAGHAAGTMALQWAFSSIHSGGAECALVGGVDSYIEPETLEWLESNEQLHGAGPDNNAYGFIPGEAATFVLLTSGERVPRLGVTPSLAFSTAATERETKLIKTDAVCVGEGLTALFHTLAAGVPPGLQVDDLYCDMNGEPYRADEFGFASIRAGGLFRDASEFTAPADCWGDIGAASGPSFLVLADAAARKGYARGSIMAAFTSAESGERSGYIATALRRAARR